MTFPTVLLVVTVDIDQNHLLSDTDKGEQEKTSEEDVQPQPTVLQIDEEPDDEGPAPLKEDDDDDDDDEEPSDNDDDDDDDEEEPSDDDDETDYQIEVSRSCLKKNIQKLVELRKCERTKRQ